MLFRSVHIRLICSIRVLLTMNGIRIRQIKWMNGTRIRRIKQMFTDENNKPNKSRKIKSVHIRLICSIRVLLTMDGTRIRRIKRMDGTRIRRIKRMFTDENNKPNFTIQNL